MFITNAHEAHVLIVYAKVDERITSFVVERDQWRWPPPATQGALAYNAIGVYVFARLFLVTLLMLSLSFSIPQVFLAISAANGLVALYIRKLRN